MQAALVVDDDLDLAQVAGDRTEQLVHVDFLGRERRGLFLPGELEQPVAETDQARDVLAAARDRGAQLVGGGGVALGDLQLGSQRSQRGCATRGWRRP